MFTATPPRSISTLSAVPLEVVCLGTVAVGVDAGAVDLGVEHGGPSAHCA